ncbi:MAG: cysteine desulfurase family protein [Christensenellales bacterium]|jgi:cysteine desulfurase
MKDIIYADNAATTRLDDDAFQAMLPWLQENYGNASQPYSFSREPKKALAEARACIAACINADPEEVIFTSGGTESDNWAIKGSALSDADHRAMITSAIEHHAVLHSCATIEKIGYPVAYLKPTSDGYILPEHLESIITDNTRLVSVMFANNELGSIQPIKELCQVAHLHGALFHTDAVQAVGHVKIDVKDLGVDMLSASAHKFNGPKGIGFLYLRKGVTLAPYFDGGKQEQGLRAGTENIPAIVGMATALKKNCKTLTHNQIHLKALEKRLLSQLDDAGLKYTRNGGKNTLPGLISLSFSEKDGEAILHRMDLMGICISTGAACDSTNTRVSHVLQAIGLNNETAKGTIRISLCKDSSEEDVVAIATALVRIINQ